jgi:hypothetical protein
LVIDVKAGDAGAVAGDVTGLELVWERVRQQEADSPGGTLLTELRTAVDRKDMAEVARLAPQLMDHIGNLDS